MWRFLKISRGLLLLLGFSTNAGCVSTQNVSWQTFPCAQPLPARQLRNRPDEAVHDDGALSLQSFAERAYAHAVELESDDDPACVDWYFQAACYVWSDGDDLPPFESRCQQLRSSTLVKLIDCGQRFDRWHSERGLRLETSAGVRYVPIEYSGFPWRPDDFDRIVTYGAYTFSHVSRTFSSRGIGVPCVAVRENHDDHPFFRETQAFPVTAMFHVTLADDKTWDGRMVLYDTKRISHLPAEFTERPLARDLTAPLVYDAIGQGSTYWENFIQSETDDVAARLYFQEPYQPGKIPVVFIHGLLSDPSTWTEMVNELQACPEIAARYQFWFFEYATGRPFLGSAAKLRQQLRAAQQMLDPDEKDPALNQIALVGHSMGGLIAELQTKESGQQLWDSAAQIPLDEVVVDEALRTRLREAFFFTSVREVTRVVTIATPFRGSQFSRQSVGRIGSSLVRWTPDVESEYETMLAANPGVFSEELSRGIPTSIDLMEPSSPILQTIDQLPAASQVPMHSVVAVKRCNLCRPPSDGVVPATSAHNPAAISEEVVMARHTQAHRRPETIREIVRILHEHLACLAEQPTAPGPRVVEAAE